MLNLDPIWMADNQQANFRLLLDAMARPGQCHSLVVTPEKGPAVLALLATLLDAEVSLADPDELLHKDDWPMLQVQSAHAKQADYVLCDGRFAPNFTPKSGTLPSPDLSATLILVVAAIGDCHSEENTSLQLTGPGIANSNTVLIKGLENQWLEMRKDWVCDFPLGVDLILVDEKQMVALPRTTKVEII
ncbi:MAG: phosphonate C-P lyase system protein PhnH [Gammaproteobacteria bacterium]|nr:phosphonate C-P lyase system protein PhnH [Gammaproteobacteria bacterium]